MIKVTQRLAFSDVFPEEKPQDILHYLKHVSLDSLLRTIGFCNTSPLPNYDSFFSDSNAKKEIIQRVNRYRSIHKIGENPEIVSAEMALKFAEVVLEHRKEFQNAKALNTITQEELNIFKAFLLINNQLNDRQLLTNLSESTHEKLVDLCIIFGFPLAEIPNFEDNKMALLQLIYTTVTKVEHLLDFLTSNPEFENLKNDYIRSFGVSDQQDFLKHMKYFFGTLLSLKVGNNYIMKVDDPDSISFLESMVNDVITADEDFTNIKNNPIYKLSNNQYSIINFFFAVDKFYKSAKFKLKDLYDKDPVLKKKYGNFFAFFNKHFSEGHLMKVVLDEIFESPRFYNKPINPTELPGEPDFYVRDNNDVFIFENKDILVAKSIKASADIEQINTLLRTKFLYDEKEKKHTGMGQLVSTIIEMQNKKFRFDDHINKNVDLHIYPILLVHDRIFQVLGINYKLNTWFRNELKSRTKSDNEMIINGLTVIDIDTLILWLPYLKTGTNFKDLLNSHLNFMEGRITEVEHQNSIANEVSNRRITELFTPVSQRSIPYEFDIALFLEKFKGAFAES